MQTEDQEMPEVDAFFDSIWQHRRTILKAPITAGMVTFSAIVLGTSAWRGLLVGFVCLIATSFHTWQRFLEPIALVAFLIASVIFINPELAAGIKTAALAKGAG